MTKYLGNIGALLAKFKRLSVGSVFHVNIDEDIAIQTILAQFVASILMMLIWK